MKGLTDEVKQFVLDQGMDLVGIAATEQLDELTPTGINFQRGPAGKNRSLKSK